ncbi:sensor histidine kinase [Paraburkholderia sp. T12-10]|nr:sensor histidine kinase [Paraburkholderia sp. T12-10]
MNMSAHPVFFRSSPDDSGVKHPLADEIMKSPAQRGGVPALNDSPWPAHNGHAPQLRNEVLAMVAHELRGTLTPLRFGAHIMRSALADRPDMLRMLDMIERQTNEIARLSEDLVDATRVGQGGLRLDKLNVDIAAILADSCEMIASAAAARRQTFTVQMPDSPLRIEGDPVRLAQAVANLLHNAVKYTPADGEISMTARAEGIDLIISVRDTGLGISDAILPHVFELFAQSSRTISASGGGMGVGLAVVKAVAESHGGTVSATSAGPGAGSEFTLRLPIVTTR